jgi:hypothetical protein
MNIPPNRVLFFQQLQNISTNLYMTDNLNSDKTNLDTEINKFCKKI